jgi:hypothetical protein
MDISIIFPEIEKPRQTGILEDSNPTSIFSKEHEPKTKQQRNSQLYGCE